MANKTIKFFGYGFGSSPATVTVTANSETVFDGAVTTLNQPVPPLPDFTLDNDTVELFSIEVDQNFSGNIPMTCTVNSGTIVFATVQNNYYPVPNPIYNASELNIIKNGPDEDRIALYEAKANPALSPADITILQGPPNPAKGPILLDHNLQVRVTGGVNDYGPCDPHDDPRDNPTIDGVAQTPDRSGSVNGCWWWKINAGSVFAYNLNVVSVPLL